jgi:uncharacterized cupredoxin-like copper-binding protein
VPKLMLVVLPFAILLAACGGDDPTRESQESGHGGHEMDMGDQSFAFGEPGVETKADRSIDITALDSLKFDPETLEVRSGETITFVVSNVGKNVHEFVLGDERYQEEHAAEMSGGEHMVTGPNQVVIPPGATVSLTWTFTESGEVLYGCHEPGHYEGGMFGTIEVRS